ncbi:MAG: tetratricopeptide repeat protein [Planctomycetes bacterium]|nr:tetratricopeptide repeat protein [Planctomycetota bacterium]
MLRQQYDEARRYFETAVRLAPRSVTAQLNLAATSLTVGRIADASEALAAVEKLDPDHRRLARLKKRLEVLQDR